jgi:hypothetical protein
LEGIELAVCDQKTIIWVMGNLLRSMGFEVDGTVDIFFDYNLPQLR